MDYDQVLDVIAPFGRYQKFIYLLQTLPVIFIAIQTNLTVFILYVPEHRCASPNINVSNLKIEGVNLDLYPLNSRTMYSKCNNYTTEFLHQMLDPMTENYNADNDNTNEFLHPNHISLKAFVDGNSPNHSSECKRWNYDTSEFETTFVTENNLVCSKKLYRTHAIVFYMAGFFIGSLLIGLLSDRFGRKVALMASIAIFITFNIDLSFVHEIWVFVTLRFFSGVSAGGLLSTCYVMDLELVGPNKRMLAGIVYMLFWGLGALLLTGMAYLIRDWRNLNLILALPTVLFLFYIKCVPESTRWLVAKGRRDEAERIFKVIAKRNNRTIQEHILPENDREAVDEQKMSIKDLCSDIRSSCDTIVIFFNWFVVALVFLGLSWNVSYLGDDVFLSFFLTSFAEIVGYLFCIPLLYRVGRKSVYFFSLLTSGFALLLTVFAVRFEFSGTHWVILSLTLVGKAGISAAFATIFLYSAERLPTVNRNSGLGIANCFARTGGMVVAYIPDLSQVVSGFLGRVLPMIVFGSLAIVAGLLFYLLLEPNERRIPETQKDVVAFHESSDRNKQVRDDCSALLNGPIQHDQEMGRLNGPVQESEESDVVTIE